MSFNKLLQPIKNKIFLRKLETVNTTSRINFAEQDIKDYIVGTGNFVSGKNGFESWGFANLFVAAKGLLSEGVNCSGYQNIYEMFRVFAIADFHHHLINRDRNHQNTNIHTSGLNVALHAIYATQEEFKTAVLLILSSRDQDFVFEHEYDEYKAQAFLIRLGTDFFGFHQRDWFGDKLTDPLLEEVMEHWDDSDTKIIGDLLWQMCNRHVLHSKSSTKKNPTDFDHMGFYYFPFEILTVLRLRQWRGLELPVIDHPLMAAPFNKLPSPSESKFELADQFYKKALEEFPDMERVIEAELEKAAHYQPEIVNKPPVQAKEAEVIEWLESTSSKKLNGLHESVSDTAKCLFTEKELDLFNRLLTLGQNESKQLAEGPLNKLIHVPNPNQSSMPVLLLVDFSVAMGWAIDLTEEVDDLTSYINRRLEQLGVATPDLAELDNLIRNPDDLSGFDLFEAEFNKANELLADTEVSLYFMDIGRDSYVTVLAFDEKLAAKPEYTAYDIFSLTK